MSKILIIAILGFLACVLLLIALVKVSQKWKREKALLDRFFEDGLAELKKVHRHIRNSQFEKITHDLRAFKCLIPTNRVNRSKYISLLKEYVQSHNGEFKIQELEDCRKLFSDATGNCSLNEEQLEAVVADEDRNLVIAGAGSGKTTVIAHKVKYLVHQGVDVNDILLVSFTNASAQDLQKRIKTKMGLEVKATTLHAFASQVNKKSAQGTKSIADDKLLAEKIFDALLKALSEKDAFRFFFEFYSKYFYDIKPLVFYTSIQDLRKDLAKVGASMLKVNDRFEELKINRNFSTLKGDMVRSIDERYIADFFYLNGIKYEYEKKYELAPYPYYPDFYLPDYNLYWEHFGLTKSGQPPPIFENPQRYLDGITEKRRLHEEKKTRLVESFSYALNEGDSSDYLKMICLKYGIITKDIDENQAHQYVSRKFQKLVQTFYCRFKLSRKNLVDLTDWARPHPAYSFFLGFFDSFIKNFEKIMDDEKKCDFTDLLIDAIAVYRSKEGQAYKYIIVDEFQDTSWVAIELLEAVAAASPDSSLFTVGDDWQSIYGFNGSDVTVMRKFKSDNSHCQVVNLDSNYRSHETIAKLSKGFIEKNENQWKKNVRSLNSKHASSTIEFIRRRELLDKIERIGRKESIFILGRYNDDEPYSLIKDLKSKGYQNIEFKTIHRSKGLEAEHVFVLFPRKSGRDFPSAFQDHYIFNVLKSSEETFPFAEERRLFYVAMTRAEKALYFVSPFDDKNPSSVFWSEISELTKTVDLKTPSHRG